MKIEFRGWDGNGLIAARVSYPSDDKAHWFTLEKWIAPAPHNSFPPSRYIPEHIWTHVTELGAEWKKVDHPINDNVYEATGSVEVMSRIINDFLINTGFEIAFARNTSPGMG